MMAPEVQVKQFVAVVRGRLGRFAVYTTGSDRHYLFAQVAPDGTLTTLSWPVAKADLQPDVARMLRRGAGNADFADERRRLPS